MRSNAASAAPATNGPALYVETMRCAGGDARGRVASGRPRHPVVEIARRQGDEARVAGGAARRVDADDLGRRHAEVGAEGVVGRARGTELALVRQRELTRCPPARPRPAPWRSPRHRASRGRRPSWRTDTRAVCDSSRRRASSCSSQGRLSTSGSSIGLGTSGPLPPPRPRARKPVGRSRSSARWASRLATRARIGTACTESEEKPRSSMTAAIGSDDVHGQRLAVLRCDGGVHPAGQGDVLAARAALVRQLEDPLGARVDRMVHRMAKAGDPRAGRSLGAHPLRPGRGPTRAAPPASGRTRRRCRARPARRRGLPPRPLPAASRDRRRASSARRRCSASARARRC